MGVFEIQYNGKPERAESEPAKIRWGRLACCLIAPPTYVILNWMALFTLTFCWGACPEPEPAAVEIAESALALVAITTFGLFVAPTRVWVLRFQAVMTSITLFATALTPASDVPELAYFSLVPLGFLVATELAWNKPRMAVAWGALAVPVTVGAAFICQQMGA